MIQSQGMAITFRQVKGQQDTVLFYMLAAPDGQPAKRPVGKKVTSNLLRQRIEEFNEKVQLLLRKAESGDQRTRIGLQSEIERLSSAVLPESGFLGLLGSTIHPHIDAFLDIAAEIPWEALNEPSLICEKNHRRTVPTGIEPEDVRCNAVDANTGMRCDLAMKRVNRRLVQDYHLTHCVYQGEKARVDGKRFAVIGDPRGDLCDPSIDRDRICEGHIREVARLVRQLGFEPVTCDGPDATTRRVRDLISDPTVAGIYYFGHGGFTDSGEPCLFLSNGELTATEIEDSKPQTRFIFLNACYAGARGSKVDTSNIKTPASVAQAFSNGPGRVVIAPAFPVLNTHAAVAATDFFRFFEADNGGLLADALKSVRDLSWKAYEADEPNICWLAYRYIGDPNTRLVLPIEQPARTQTRRRPAVPRTPATRVFDAEGRLKTTLFAFDIAEALNHAVARRDKQARTLLSPLDFLTGLIVKGGLTRFILGQEGIDIDTLSAGLNQRQEIETAVPGRNSSIPAGPGQKRQDFSEALIAIIEKTDQRAKDMPRISEQDVLETFVDGGNWGVEDSILLPQAGRVLARLRAPKDVDENGLVPLSGLDAAARKIIETAHRLAQQRGWQDIPNRLVLAALVSLPGGFGARVCQCAGVDPELLCSFMIALMESEGSDGNPRTFGLSYEVCRRVVIPTLAKARKLAGDGAVGERHLFHAFCEIADGTFKEALRLASVEMNTEQWEMGKVDLDSMALIDPEFWEKELAGLDENARKVIREAFDLSQDCGVANVPNRLLLAGFLARPDWLVPTFLRRKNLSAETLKAQLVAAIDTGTPRKFALDDNSVRRAIRPVIEKAREIAQGEPAGPVTLLQGFCATAPAEMKNFLRAPAFGLDLDILAKESAEPLGPDEAESETAAGEAHVDWDPHPFRAEQFEEKAWHVLGEAARLAKQDRWDQIRSPHLLASVLCSGTPAIDRMLSAARMTAAEAQKAVFAMLHGVPKGEATDRLRLGARAAQLVSLAVQFAGQQGHSRVTADDLFVSLSMEQNGPAASVIQSLGGGLAFVAQGANLPVAERPSALGTLGVDLTERARQCQLPAIVGRDDEIETALQTLHLLENANPLLVGESGVGKTAIVEGIAQRIVGDNCPKKLSGMRVIELSAGSLVADTRLRGQFEQRIQEILAEARENVILFIDEIHTIVGAGSAESSALDAGNMLKTALSKGEIRLIGATTNAEFRRTIARDRALSRRFQTQIIGPPSREATLVVLATRRAILEKHHDVKISEESEAAAVDLSGRYIVDKHWPAKARDVIERACVLASLEGQAKSPDNSVPLVTREHVARVVSRWVGVPLERLTADDWQLLAKLEDRLSRRIVGQEAAIKTVAEAIRRGRQGLAGRNRPWGVFMFIGPPGVGKTELAKVVGEEVFGGPEGVVRFDMGDFTEPHAAARLIGAPPGYVGYTDGAPLVERLRAHPYSLLLFDEIEHAHEQVLAVLLRLLSEGTVTDGDGNLADARNCIVIFTSNLLGRGDEGGKLGFVGGSSGSGQADLRSLLERRLPRKLIDRMDGIIRFNQLTENEVVELIRREVEDRKAQLEVAYGIPVEIAADVVPWLSARVSEAGQGGRAVRRTVDDHVGGAMSAALSKRPASPFRMLICVADDGGSIVARWIRIP